jgi:hypothetical protein
MNKKRFEFELNSTNYKVKNVFDDGTEIKALIPSKGKMLVYSTEDYPEGGLSSLTQEEVEAKIIEKLSA